MTAPCSRKRDLACQSFLLQRLPEIVPCPVIGEEMSRAEQEAALEAGNGDVWCIDPIDGTTNFVNGLPVFAVSIALLRERKPRLGHHLQPHHQRTVLCLGGRWRLRERQAPAPAPGGRQPGPGGGQCGPETPAPGTGRPHRHGTALLLPAQLRQQRPGVVPGGRGPHRRGGARRPDAVGLRRRLPDPEGSGRPHVHPWSRTTSTPTTCGAGASSPPWTPASSPPGGTGCGPASRPPARPVLRRACGFPGRDGRCNSPGPCPCPCASARPAPRRFRRIRQ